MFQWKHHSASWSRKKNPKDSPFHDQDMLRASIWNDCIYRLCQFNEIQGVEEEIVFFPRIFIIWPALVTFGGHLKSGGTDIIWNQGAFIWNFWTAFSNNTFALKLSKHNYTYNKNTLFYISLFFSKCHLL